jgi:Zn-finger nucleic acid-binding protein
MALLIEATAETLRLCPSDGERMSKEVAHMIVIDRCPKCQGVWLDGGELERLQTSAQDAALRAMTMSFTHPLS